jgi:hypothetical protein
MSPASVEDSQDARGAEYKNAISRAEFRKPPAPPAPPAAASPAAPVPPKAP